MKKWFEELFNKTEVDFSYDYKGYFKRLKELKVISTNRSYPAIFVLATDIKKKNGDIVFRKKDEHGALDKYFRLDAVIKLIKNKKITGKVLLIGGCNKDLGKFRTEAMRDYIIEKLDEENIKTIEERRCCPGNTCGNIVGIVNYLNQECSSGEKVGIVTNLYHCPRIEELLRDCGESYLNKIEFIPAEMVLADEDKKKKEINEFYKSKEMKKRFSSEIKGIRDVKRGKYSCRKYLDPKYLDPNS